VGDFNASSDRHEPTGDGLLFEDLNSPSALDVFGSEAPVSEVPSSANSSRDLALSSKQETSFPARPPSAESSADLAPLSKPETPFPELPPSKPEPDHTLPRKSGGDEPPMRFGWRGAAAIACIAALVAVGSFVTWLQSPRTTHPVVTASSPARDNAANGLGSSGHAPPSTGLPQSLPGFSPAFAADGSIFFHTGRSGAERSDIVVAHVASGQPRIDTIIGDGARNYHVQPSPDGRFIAFDSDRDGIRGVYVAKRDGSETKRVGGAGYAALPTWAPDGQRIAFVRAEPNRPTVWNLWVLSVDSDTARRLTNYQYGQTWGASWFPDGERIAYTHETKLIVRDLTNGSTREFDSPIRHRLMRTPAVSGDGTRVVFQVYHDGVWMLNLTNESMHRVLAQPTAEEFAWAPDGNRIAFHSRRDGRWRIQFATLPR
jgi:hypothetical protein